jgi:y4mF family transcriptional regulator
MKNVMDIKGLGAEIRRLRKEAGLRQDELAGVSGVGVRFLVELEHGKDTAQIGKVFKVLRALGCEVFMAKRGVFS